MQLFKDIQIPKNARRAKELTWIVCYFVTYVPRFESGPHGTEGSINAMVSLILSVTVSKKEEQQQEESCANLFNTELLPHNSLEIVNLKVQNLPRWVNWWSELILKFI